MANPFNSEVGQQNKSGGSGPKDKRTSAPSPSLNMKTGPFHAMSGGTGPNRNTVGWRKIKQHTQDKGI